MTAASAPGRKSVVTRYWFTSDHKIVGLQFLWLSFAGVFLGLLLSVAMRLHLIFPEMRLPILGEVKPEDYLGLMTMHASFMVFFVASLLPQNALGSYLLPLQIGAREMRFPWLNALSFWITALSFLAMVSALVAPGGPPSSGWTHYAPLSAIPSASPGLDRGMDRWLISIALLCLATLLGSVNFIATTLGRRCPGLAMMRLPLSVWTWFVTAVLSLLAFSALLVAAVMLYCDRRLGTSFFVPAVIVNGIAVAHRGGSPLLWQHLFWFFGHPEVYIAILPGMGIVSSVIPAFARRPLFGYRAMVNATLAIGAFGMAIWGHHMFVSGMDPHAVMAFSLLTMAVAVPSGLKTFNWLGTLWRGRIRFTSAMLFALGFISLFVTGGLTGPILAQPRLNAYLHDTYFVVAHFHLIMAIAGGFATFAGIYFWFPRLFGRFMDERLGKLHFWASFLGAYAIFMPMHLLGLAGHPRRYSELAASANYVQQLLPLQRFITYAAILTAAAQLIFFWNFFASMRRGRPAPVNPWEATTLEWSPPSLAVPEAYRGPYEYVAGEPDFVPQWETERRT